MPSKLQYHRFFTRLFKTDEIFQFGRFYGEKAVNWAAKQQTSWFITPWWFCVSLWWICITFVWLSSSQKSTAPSSQLKRHLHFALIRLCLALLFIISITDYTMDGNSYLITLLCNTLFLKVWLFEFLGYKNILKISSSF